MANEVDELAAHIAIGDQAKKFKESEIGRYLALVAKQDEDEAKDRLLAIDVWKYTTLSELQNEIASIQFKVNRFKSIEQYLYEAITEGEEADRQLNSEEDA